MNTKLLVYPIACANSFTNIFVNSVSQNSINLQQQPKFTLICLLYRSLILNAKKMTA